MTEQPDTARILFIVGPPRTHVDRTVVALCNALDAARAERDQWHAIATSPTVNEQNWKTRAEAAEAYAAAAKTEHAKALTRINNALALVDGLGSYSDIRRALTGDTT